MYILDQNPIQLIVIFSIAPIVGALIGYIIATQQTDMGEAQKGSALTQISQGIGYALVRIVDVIVFMSSSSLRKQLKDEGEAQNGG